MKEASLEGVKEAWNEVTDPCRSDKTTLQNAICLSVIPCLLQRSTKNMTALDKDASKGFSISFVKMIASGQRIGYCRVNLGRTRKYDEDCLLADRARKEPGQMCFGNYFENYSHASWLERYWFIFYGNTIQVIKSGQNLMILLNKLLKVISQELIRKWSDEVNKETIYHGFEKQPSKKVSADSNEYRNNSCACNSLRLSYSLCRYCNKTVNNNSSDINNNKHKSWSRGQWLGAGSTFPHLGLLLLLTTCLLSPSQATSQCK